MGIQNVPPESYQASTTLHGVTSKKSRLYSYSRESLKSHRGVNRCPEPSRRLTLLQQSLRDECPLRDGSFYVHCPWRLWPLFHSFFSTALCLFETRFTLHKNSILLLSIKTFFLFEQKIETSNSNIYCFMLIYYINICYHILFWKYESRLMRPHSSVCVYLDTWGQLIVVLHK